MRIREENGLIVASYLIIGGLIGLPQLGMVQTQVVSWEKDH
jgi:hypothetical protein